MRNSFILFVTSLIKDCHDTSAKRRGKAAAKTRVLSFNRLKTIRVSVFHFHDTPPLYVVSLINMTVLHHTIAPLFYFYLNETEWQHSSSLPLPTQHTPQYLVRRVSAGIRQKKPRAITTDFWCFYSYVRDVCANSHPTQLDTWSAGLAAQSRCFLEENWRGCRIRWGFCTSKEVFESYYWYSASICGRESFATKSSEFLNSMMSKGSCMRGQGIRLASRFWVIVFECETLVKWLINVVMT